MRRKAAPRKVEWTVAGGAADTTVDICPQKLRKLGDCCQPHDIIIVDASGTEWPDF